jgi:hypothetical protein
MCRGHRDGCGTSKGLSWLTPFGYAVVALLLVPTNSLAWPARVPIDASSLTVAVVLVALGLLAVTLRGARDRPEVRVLSRRGVAQATPNAVK